MSEYAKLRDSVKDKFGVDIPISDDTIDYVLLASFVTGAGHTLYENYFNVQGALNISDPRERMANQLLRRGHASIDEILTSSFGEWPPKGLDIVTTNPQRVQFGSILKRADDIPNQGRLENLWARLNVLNNTFGDATLSQDRIIRMNNLRLSVLPGLLGKSALSSTLGHEGVHILQGDNYYRAAQIYGYHGEDWVVDKGQMVMNKNDPVKKIFAAHTDNSFFGKLTEGNTKHLDYLRSGIETQARIHEITAAGYQRWGQLPANREQFLVAMKDSGLKIPEKIMEELEQSPTIAETKRIFSSAPHSSAQADEINYAQKGLTPAGKIQFWNKAMPELYADLIEMYGDGPGRARFDMGDNLRPLLRAPIDASKPILGTGEDFVRALQAGDPNAAIMVAPGIKDKMTDSNPDAPAIKTIESADTKPPIDQDIHHKPKGIRGGLVANVLIGSGAGILAYSLTGDIKESGKISFQTIVPYGETALKIAEGDTKGAIHATMTETAGIAGAIGGAVTGASIGSVVPIVGTAIGAIAGGIIGGVGAGMGTDVVLKNVPEIVDRVKKVSDNTMTHISGAAASIKQKASHAFEKAASTAQNTKHYVSDTYDSIKGKYANWFNKNANPDETPSKLTPEQVYKALPEKSTPDMPPEIQSLIEVKASPKRFQQTFEDLRKQKSLDEVEKYINNNANADIEATAAETLIANRPKTPLLVLKP